MSHRSPRSVTRRRSWAYATVACIAVGLVAQSCAVMSSSSDCADKANCTSDEGGSSGVGASSSSGGSSSSGAGSGDGSPTAAGDATSTDVSAETGPDADATAGDVVLVDVTIDQGGNLDARNEGTGVRDVANGEAAGDATNDVVNEPAIDAPPDVFDGCTVSGNEVCTNNTDDNCDGKIDCADPQCSGFTCVAGVPTGWSGPALLWLGAATSGAPTCPAGYQTALDAHQGPTGTPDTCNCSCAASGQTCAVTTTIHADQACNQTACATATNVTNGCTAVPANTCGTGGSFDVIGAVPAPTGGACTATPAVVTPGSTPGWTTSARICSLSGAPDTPGGCNPTTDTCVPVSPGSGGFSATLCVYHVGDVACPAEYPNNRNVVFAGEDGSSRGCSACSCSTASPVGGTCAGSLTLFPLAGCTGNASPVYNLGGNCVGYNNQSPITPMSVQASYTVGSGSCTVGTQSQPTGSVVGTGPTTVCCL